MNKKIRKIIKARWFKIIAFVIVFLITYILFLALTFEIKCKDNTQVIFGKESFLSPEIIKLKESIKDYNQTEESTYLTLPEWYTVYSYQEYADFISKNRPSKFPYFSSIGQFWSSYCHVYGLTRTKYPFNAGNHLMLSVVGTSFSAEYAIKGLYEKTFGRLTEWLSSYETEEDKYNGKIATDYGNFIPTEPWYEYPFGKSFIGLWKDTKLFGPHILRKVERKFILSLEYSVKTVYAWLIKLGTHSVYGAPVAQDYLLVENFSKSFFVEEPRIHEIKKINSQSFIISVPHYQGFSDTIPWLARRGVKFVDISGNDEIMLTAIVPQDWNYNLGTGQLLFSMKILTDPNIKRIVVKTPVKSLGYVLTDLDTSGAKIEHIYDY